MVENIRMRRKMVNLFLCSVLFFISLFPCRAQAADQVITLGKDLSAKEKEEVYKMMRLDPAKIDSREIPVLEVTNQEERNYLAGYIPENLIGTKAISSCYVERLGAGEGITVNTENITWVTERMYANALVTAGIKDAEVLVVAPHKVSGTAALTGIYKSFEKAAGTKLAETNKKTAAEELVRTGELGEEVGQNTAAEIVARSKEQVIEKNANTPGEIRTILRDVVKDLNANITVQREETLIELLTNIKKLNLDVKVIKEQLNKDTAGDRAPETKTPDWLSKIIAFFMDFWKKLFTWVRFRWK